jgi:hypothetical protein
MFWVLQPFEFSSEIQHSTREIKSPYDELVQNSIKHLRNFSASVLEILRSVSGKMSFNKICLIASIMTSIAFLISLSLVIWPPKGNNVKIEAGSKILKQL